MKRLLFCFFVSVFLHALVFNVSWEGEADPVAVSSEDPVRVSLVEPEVIEEAAEDVEEEEVPPAITFEVDGNVSDGYMDRLKSRVFFLWEYPQEAINQGRDGVVVVSFVLDGRGRLMDSGVVVSSGCESLDREVLVAIEKGAPYGRFTEDVETEQLKITGHFCYVLD